MDKILTHNNIEISPYEPKVDDIFIDDIAHSLSYQCRANGHFDKFYSVAQHCINCATEAKARGLSSKIQLGCLLHDGAETYMSDIPRPVKHNLTEFINAENKLLQLIYDKYIDGVFSDEEMAEVNVIDNLMLDAEFAALKTNYKVSIEIENVLKSEPSFEHRSFGFNKNRFLALFYSLVGNKFKSPYLNFERDHKNKYIGIDGAKGCWIVVCISGEGYEVKKINRISEIQYLCNKDNKIWIDIPIGLPENKEEIQKRPDDILRNNLGKKGSSVFNVPPRSVIYAADEASAKQLNMSMGNGKGLSKQSWGFSKYIRDVDTFLIENEKLRGSLSESHPEYCFMVLNKGEVVISKKDEEQGIQERIDILSRYYPDTFELMNATVRKFNNSTSLRNDILDALSMAVCAKLSADYTLGTIPEEPYEDKYGFKMQIVYPKIGD